MTRFRVELAPTALAHAEQIQAWWVEHRPSAPTLFADELAALTERLATAPLVGGVYVNQKAVGFRRALLQRCRYHAYYTVIESQSLVRIHAIWHLSRGRQPTL